MEDIQELPFCGGAFGPTFDSPLLHIALAVWSAISLFFQQRPETGECPAQSSRKDSWSIELQIASLAASSP